MKRSLLCVVAALVYCSLPAWVSAEGFLPGMPSFGGWSCSPGQKPDCSVAGKVGYLGYNKGLVFQMAAVRTPLAQALDIQQQFPLEGIWVGTSAKGAGPQRGGSACDPGESLCILVGGSWAFPNNEEGIEQFTPEQHNGGGLWYRNWRPKTQWYSLEAAVSRCAVANFSLVGGFRYDSFSMGLANPSEATPALSLASDEAELILSSYIPYVGGITRWGGVQVGVLGFPYVPGTIVYKETLGPIGQRLEAIGNYSSSYFLEAFAEWGRQMRVFHLSVFATYTVLHAAGEFEVSLSPAGSSQPYKWGMDRQNCIVGGKAVIGFNSPL